jgi:hypothetical protein
MSTKLKAKSQSNATGRRKSKAPAEPVDVETSIQDFSEGGLGRRIVEAVFKAQMLKLPSKAEAVRLVEAAAKGEMILWPLLDEIRRQFDAIAESKMTIEHRLSKELLRQIMVNRPVIDALQQGLAQRAQQWLNAVDDAHFGQV